MKRKKIIHPWFFIIMLCTPMLLWADDYWQLPIPLQGDAPQEHHPLTQGLDPKNCRVCHKKQYDEWQDSWHAKAASPGLLGQLYYFDEASAESCLTCHTPRSEQILKWRKQTSASQGMPFQSPGIDCASCHVRQHQRYGANKKATTPHGVVNKEPLFKQAKFCSPCHQFSEGKGLKLAGTFLENTHQEWQQSSWAKQGKTCQGCHMPKGSHRFRGIHDPEMTRSAFKIKAVREATGFRLSLTNHAAGHALPTYATPRIVVTMTSARQENQQVKQHIIQRELYLDGNQSLQQKKDTRLQPQQTLELFLKVAPQAQATASIRVEPDYFYQQVVYPYFLDDVDDEISPEEKQALQLLQQAKQAQRDYTLFDITCPNWQLKNTDCQLSPNP